MANREVKAFGILLVSGFLAGFCLSSGSAHWFGPAADKPRAEAAPAEAPLGGGAGGGGKGGQHGGAEREGEGKAVAMAPGKLDGGGAPAKEKGGPLPDGEDAKVAGQAASPPAPAPPMPDNALAELLSGNTIEVTGGEGRARHRYMSRRGWQGDPAEDAADTFLIHRWVVRGGRLCEMVSEQAVACQGVTFAKQGSPRNEVGARLGTLTLDSGQSWPVLKGNVAGMPEVAPLIDGTRRLARIDDNEPDVVKAIVGRPMIRDAREDGPVVGTAYVADGRWVTTEPIARGARSGTGGVRMTVGQWAVRNGLLCEDDPGLDLSRRCYAATRAGGGTFRLTPSLKGSPAVALSILAEGA